jgi:ankyrin repeat protein
MGESVDAAERGNGFTALMHAARCGQEAVVDALLVRQADVGRQDDFGYTALMLAAMEGHVGTSRR